MATYRSLVMGGYFSSTPMDKNTGPVSIRMNNPGAVNGASWEKAYPGYVSEIETTPGNRSTIFEAPEYGVAVWWDLMRRYRDAGAVSVKAIITRYGGGQDYSKYVTQVCQWSGLEATTEIKLYGDDATLLKFAKAMFRYEAGRAIPWSDAQITCGLQFGRDHASAPPLVPTQPAPVPAPPPVIEPELPWWIRLLYALFGKPVRPDPGLVFIRILKRGSSGQDVRELQVRLQELGWSDLVVDGDFGESTQKAVRAFQTRRNLDPDGEVGETTIAELNRKDAGVVKPPLMPPSEAKFGPAPSWYNEAAKYIGFHEIGDNQGIEKFIALAKCGKPGNAWCAIFANGMLQSQGVPGTLSTMARSFANHSNFVRLAGPALGCVAVMWRDSPNGTLGHVFFYDGENSSGIRGIGANEDDQVKRSFHDRKRIVGYFWPKGISLPKVGPIAVSDLSTPVAGRET